VQNDAVKKIDDQLEGLVVIEVIDPSRLARHLSSLSSTAGALSNVSNEWGPQRVSVFNRSR
jgi:hypothetical protein